VIPLCESDNNGSHLTDPFTLLGSTPINGYTSDMGSTDRPFVPSSSVSIVRAGSETGSETDPLHGPPRLNGSALPNGNGPLLRRNQYWV
jgi:hypothetical protein